MDAISTALGLTHARPVQPKSLTDWNADYEADSIHNDWWFKAAVAVTGWVRSAIQASANTTTSTSQFARA